MNDDDNKRIWAEIARLQSQGREAEAKALHAELQHKWREQEAGRRRALVAAGDYLGALGRCSSFERVGALREMWDHVPSDQRCHLFADAVSGGDGTHAERDFIIHALSELPDKVVQTRRNTHVGLVARRFLDRLPDVLTVYRGACFDEVDDEWTTGGIGTSWTLSREKALWFAKDHGRGRNTDSDPCLLLGRIKRARCSVYLNGREEREMVLDPDDMESIEVEPC